MESGKVVGTFESIGSAAAAAGCHQNTLGRYMKDDKPLKGYHYRYPCRDTLPDEEWRVCRDAPLYEASNLGRVRNRSTGKPLRENLMTTGYLKVKLALGGGTYKDSFVSRLVATEFVSLP